MVIDCKSRFERKMELKEVAVDVRERRMFGMKQFSSMGIGYWSTGRKIQRLLGMLSRGGEDKV